MKLSVLMASLLVLSVSLFGQAGAGQGAISGVVVDATGGAVPNATITLTNESKGVRRVMETTSDGIFSAPALVPADGYQVSVKKAGFADYDG